MNTLPNNAAGDINTSMDSFLDRITIHRKLPANTLGTDYVIGDIHGMVEFVDALLDKVSFNPVVDRLFLVGDLADRGPESVESLRLLLRPYVYATMGNHEELLLRVVWDELFANMAVPGFFKGSSADFIRNGGQWLLAHMEGDDWLSGMVASNPDFMTIMLAASKLPLVISVGDGDDRFNMTHSELPMHFTDAIIDQLPASVPIYEVDEENSVSLWMRNIFRLTDNALPQMAEGLSTTFTGHTAGKHIRKALSHACIDTGAYKSHHYLLAGDSVYRDYGLTIVNASTMQALTMDADYHCVNRHVPNEDAVEASSALRA